MPHLHPRTRPARLLFAALLAAALPLAACGDGRTASPTAAGGGLPPAQSGSEAASGSGPQDATQTPAAADTGRAAEVVKAWSDEQLAGGVLVVTYDGKEPSAAAAPVGSLHAAGVIVMGYNVSSASQVQATTEAVRTAARADGRDYPPVIGVDQEGGTVARLGGVVPELPTFMASGAAIRGDQAAGAQAVTAASKAAGEQLRALGFTWVFAPDADVTVGPADPTIGSRSAGDDPQLVAQAVTAAVTGYREADIVPSVKHWPGHGSVTQDSHNVLPVHEVPLSELRQRDFVPFKAAAQAGVPVMMMSHIAHPEYDKGVPSTVSPKAYASLRQETGFTGIVVTDAMNMGAVNKRYPGGEGAVKALQAGADLVLMPTDAKAAHTAVVTALGDGTLDRDKVRASAAKIVALQQQQRDAVTDLATANTAVEQTAQALAAAAVTQVSGSCQAPVDGAVQVAGGTEAQRAAFLAAAKAAGLRTGSGPTVTLVPKGGSLGRLSVAVDTPYVLGKAQGTGYALFGDDEPAFRALLDVLTGKAKARGGLPVTVAGVNPPRC